MAGNHWIAESRKRRKRFWTVEFSKYATFVLRPRKVDVTYPSFSLSASGRTEVVFRDGLTATDRDFADFLVEARRGMANWLGRMRLYADVISELECYELRDLSYWQMASRGRDVVFGFGYGNASKLL